MSDFRGKSVQALIRDIADGYVAVNPIFLKSFQPEALKVLFAQLTKIQAEIRGTPFPSNDVPAIRDRNMKLQRLHSASIVIRHFAKSRRILLA